VVIKPRPPPVPDFDEYEDIVIVSGDTLSGLAKKHYGSLEYWPLLWDANRLSVDNPNRLVPGRLLKVPYFSKFTLAELLDATRRAPTWRQYR